MQTIDKRTALRLLTKAVKSNPEKTAICVYFKDGNAECVAGAFMADLGVKVADLPNDTFDDLIGSLNDSTNNSLTAERIKAAFGDVRLTKGATRVVTFIQALQDGRMSSAADMLYGYQSLLAPLGPEREAFFKDVEQNYGAGEDRCNWRDALALTKKYYDSL